MGTIKATIQFPIYTITQYSGNPAGGDYVPLVLIFHIMKMTLLRNNQTKLLLIRTVELSRQNQETLKKNNPKKENITKESGNCKIKTPVFPSTPVKVYDDAQNSKLEMLSDLKTKL